MGTPTSATKTRLGMRSVAALALALLVSLIFVGSALADQLVNNLDTSADPTREAMALSTTAGSTVISVTPEKDDGQQNCNFTG